MAAFAGASLGRLWLVQFVVATLVAGNVAWVFYSGVFPTVREAIRQLPDAGDIRGAKLDWRGASPVLLAEGGIVAFTVDLDHSGDVRSPAHFQFEFGREEVMAHSLLGYLEVRYPRGWLIAFNRPELEPKWGAWEMPILGIVVLATVAWLLVAWSALATLYVLPVWLVAFFANRDLKFGQCWRLAGAALMPGAVATALAIFLYGLGVLDLVAFAGVGAGHLVVGWIYLCLSPTFLPRSPEAAMAGNPFAGEKK